MNRFVRYTNGNYTVTIDTRTGTKIRENDLDFFRAEFPESMDIKICDKCDMGCPMCHENSTPDGKCGDILNAKFIETLHPYTELAIGGGNPLEHPDLEAFLVKCKVLMLIPSMTVNQTHFMKNKQYLKTLCDSKLIYGLGISVNKVDNDFLEALKDFPNAVLHVINGLVTIHDLAMLAGKDLKILFLGYKEFRRGKDLFKRDAFAIERRKIRRRRTTAPMPTPEVLLKAWNERKSSRKAMILLGGIMHDLECYVDNCLRFDESGNVVGRNGGIRGWLKENVPELFPKYKTLMRYKALAVRLRQATDTKDPKPTSKLLEKPFHKAVATILADEEAVFARVFSAVEHMLSPATVMLDAPKGREETRRRRKT